MGDDYRQCSRCVLDTTDPDIYFNDKGYCNHCTEYHESIAKMAYQGEASDRKLEAMVAKIKKAGKNRVYDCLIGISGGIDSCYVAYLAKNLGLKPLAVHMDNGWNSEEAVKNIKNVCNILGIDYQSYVLDWQEFKDIQLAFLKSSIVEVEIPTDIGIPASLHKVAVENKIKYILSGGNFATEGLLPNSWFYNPKDSKLFKAICKQFGTRKISSFPTYDYIDEMYYKFIKGIRILYPLNHIPFSKEEAMKTLKEKLDWKDYGGKHYESKYTGFVQSYIQPVKFNVDYRRATFSTQICTGEITREQALEELKNKPYPYDPEKIDMEIAYVCKKLELSTGEFDDIMNLPIKTYRDYPNNEKKLNFIYGVYRKLYN